MPASGVPAAVGSTPLIRLNRIFDSLNFRLFAKLELLNPGGSSKDRPALNLIRRALEDGLIGEGSTTMTAPGATRGI